MNTTVGVPATVTTAGGTGTTAERGIHDRGLALTRPRFCAEERDESRMRRPEMVITFKAGCATPAGAGIQVSRFREVI